MGTSSSGAPGADPEKDDIFNVCCTDADDDAYISFSVFGWSRFVDGQFPTVITSFLVYYYCCKQAIAGLAGGCCEVYRISEMGTYSRQ